MKHMYIYVIVIFIISMSLFESTLFSFCKLKSKLDLPTLRQGSSERKNATEQIKNMILAGFEPWSSAFRVMLYPLRYGVS